MPIARAQAEGMRLTGTRRWPLVVALLVSGLIAGAIGYAAGTAGGADNTGQVLPGLPAAAPVSAIGHLSTVDPLPRRPATTTPAPSVITPPPVITAPPAGPPPPAPPPPPATPPPSPPDIIEK